MVEIASSFAQDKGAGNVRFQLGTAESLPFPDNSFDLITCRYAAHHFSDVRKAVSEVARVLKKDGRFLLVDHYAPEDSVLDEFINQLNRLRDPSHVRESSLSEWQSMFTANQLGYQEVQKWNLPIQYESWIKRSGTPADREKQIITHLNDASDEARDMFHIKMNQNGQPGSFCLKAILIQGIKR